MNDEIREFGLKIEKAICPECRRVDLPCHKCPVQELADICRAIKKRERNKEVTMTLISRQQFEYLCDVGVVSINSGSSDLVRYPDGMEHCSLLSGNMTDDLLKDTPWSVKFNPETHESPDTRVTWCIPEWLFMENQKEVLSAYFGGR